MKILRLAASFLGVIKMEGASRDLYTHFSFVASFNRGQREVFRS